MPNATSICSQLCRVFSIALSKHATAFNGLFMQLNAYLFISLNALCYYTLFCLRGGACFFHFIFHSIFHALIGLNSVLKYLKIAQEFLRQFAKIKTELQSYCELHTTTLPNINICITTKTGSIVKRQRSS